MKKRWEVKIWRKFEKSFEDLDLDLQPKGLLMYTEITQVNLLHLWYKFITIIIDIQRAIFFLKKNHF